MAKKRKKKVATKDPDFYGKKAVKKTKTATTKPRKKTAAKIVDVKKPAKKSAKGTTAKNTTTKNPATKSSTAKSKKVTVKTAPAKEVELAPRVDTVLATPQAKKLKKRAKLPVVARIVLATIGLFLVSLVIAWFILWRQNLGDGATAAEFVSEKPVLYLYSALVAFGLLAVLAAATWRPILTAGIGFAAASILTYIHMQKFIVRNAPLLPEDFKLVDQAGNLMDFVDPWSVVRLVLGVIMVIAATATAEFFVRKWFRGEIESEDRPKWWKRTQLVPRAVLTVASVAVLSVTTTPIIRRESPEWMEGLALSSWNQTENYENNGFVIGFLSNLGQMEMKAAEDYGPETMASIARVYREKKAADTDRKPLGDVVDNLIVILDESYYDPAVFTKYYDHVGGDVTPVLHRIFQNYPSGYMFSPEYGGNTANVEFEVQTGLTNFWANDTLYLNVLPKLGKFLSVASWARGAGFRATAVHSYEGSMYKRNLTYPVLGYEEFFDAGEFSYKWTEYSSSYLNDRALFREVLDIVEEADEDDERKPQMIGAVTMQNHAPYDSAKYPELDYLLKNPSGVKNAALIEADFQSIHEADAYLGDFLKKLAARDDRTVVLWFGDHAAGILDEYIYSEDQDERRLAHLTPYFIWANFEIESPYTTEEVAEMNKKWGIELPSKIRGVDMPTMTPNCLQNAMYNLIGAEKPALFYLVDEVCETTPILARAYYEKAEPEGSEALTAYELVNYDALAGKRYWDGR